MQRISYKFSHLVVRPHCKMAAFSTVAQQVKLDILSKTHALDNAAKRKEISRTFISDTVTVPTKEMYEYATLSTLGDDVYFEPSTKALEDHMAQLTGKEAGLFMSSGTASNQIALRTHLLQPPYSVLVDHRAHISKYEAGGAAFHSGAATTALIPANGHHLTLDEVKRNIILGTDTHFAPTEVVALENTLNGTIFPQDEIIAISDYVHSEGKKMHLDGARLWHVAAETETSMKELCDPFDSVSLCFSKGLGAPIGSCLVGSAAFIAKARWFRKLFGGGMRQTGILAASAAYALTYNFPQLPRVHALARRLEAALEEIGVEITSKAETCMIFYDPSSIGVTYDEIADRATDLPEPLILGGSRLVVHIQTTESAVDDFLSVVRQLAEEKKAAGFVKPPTANGGNGYKDIYVRRALKTSA
ncbi:pyridoxal phosphate-dependent transferase [Mycena olivaceomarginata]|nr:pyridoxal phosphate-dependent transferase [Mycena olivaceomarginata]